MAHSIWSSLGSSEHDYDFTFQTVTTQVLYDLLSSTERQTIKASPQLSGFGACSSAYCQGLRWTGWQRVRSGSALVEYDDKISVTVADQVRLLLASFQILGL